MFKEIWNRWKIFAQKVGTFQINLIFSILFYIIIVPVGLVFKLFRDVFETKSFPNWSEVKDLTSTLPKMKEQ